MSARQADLVVDARRVVERAELGGVARCVTGGVAPVGARLGAFVDRLEAEPKTRSWRLRARIGERRRWYELPEEARP